MTSAYSTGRAFMPLPGSFIDVLEYKVSPLVAAVSNTSEKVRGLGCCSSCNTAPGEALIMVSAQHDKGCCGHVSMPTVACCTACLIRAAPVGSDIREIVRRRCKSWTPRWTRS